jgi:hypothetical protein
MNRSLLLPLLIVLFSSCNNEDITGPEIINVTDSEFSAYNITVNSTTVDFENGDEVFLNANFDQNKTVNITFTGLNSGAEKSFSLNSSELNKQNSLWLGGSSNSIGFQTEECQVRVSFYGTSQMFLDTITLKTLQTYNFEGMLNSQLNGFEDALEWPTYHTEWSSISSEINVPQGLSCLKVDFTNKGYTYIYEENQLDPAAYFDLPQTPQDIYFNVYVYGINDPNAQIIYEFLEDDKNNLKWDRGQEDGVQMIIPLGHKGWQLFSMRYDKIPFSTFALGGGSGNKTHEPHKIKVISCGMESKTATSGTTYLDFPIFTIGKPFKPEEF